MCVVDVDKYVADVVVCVVNVFDTNVAIVVLMVFDVVDVEHVVVIGVDA